MREIIVNVMESFLEQEAESWMEDKIFRHEIPKVAEAIESAIKEKYVEREKIENVVNWHSNSPMTSSQKILDDLIVILG